MNSIPNPRILLRSAWQTVNIGDIGHTPGALRLFERYFPEAEVTLWPNNVDRGVREQLLVTFPRLTIVEGEVDRDGVASNPEMQRAFDESDVFVHGSAPNVMAWWNFEAWRKTGKPYGIFGITFDRSRRTLTQVDGETKLVENDWEGGTLDQLRAHLLSLPVDSISPKEREFFQSPTFAFFRDTITLEYVKQQFPNIPHAAFGPDATFVCDIRDDATADKWLQANGLEEKKFICAIPRLRWTPYHLIHHREPDETEKIQIAISERHRVSDITGLREMIIRWVRETGLKAVVCPEMTYQIELGREQIIDKLPDDVKDRVILRDTYWLNDEASSVYRKAHTVVSMDNHSPILALAQGTPTIFMRQPTDTIKGQMWPDLGLGPDFFEVGDATGDALWQRLSIIHADYPAAQARVAALCARAEEFMREMVMAVKRAVGAV